MPFDYTTSISGYKAEEGGVKAASWIRLCPPVPLLLVTLLPRFPFYVSGIASATRVLEGIDVGGRRGATGERYHHTTTRYYTLPTTSTLLLVRSSSMRECVSTSPALMGPANDYWPADLGGTINARSPHVGHAVAYITVYTMVLSFSGIYILYGKDNNVHHGDIVRSFIKHVDFTHR